MQDSIHKDCMSVGKLKAPPCYATTTPTCKVGGALQFGGPFLGEPCVQDVYYRSPYLALVRSLGEDPWIRLRVY